VILIHLLCFRAILPREINYSPTGSFGVIC
jgi:hypothetical protein